uniref:Uncharacterized protein n=1 Tax=Ananas comosus var. bracteatus TaxID=296719 RepID=A0A6V7QAI2_ANACO|nr:unnamed protein product [Ananas comosus var. bracteatus]
MSLRAVPTEEYFFCSSSHVQLLPLFLQSLLFRLLLLSRLIVARALRPFTPAFPFLIFLTPKPFHRRICLLPKPLHSGRIPSPTARSPFPKPLHIRPKPFTAGRTPPPPASPPAEPLHLRLHLRPKPFTFALSPSPPAKPFHLRLHLRLKPFPSAEARYRRPNPSPPASPPPKALHLRPYPFTAGRTPSPPASLLPEALHCRPNPFTYGFTSARSPSHPPEALPPPRVRHTYTSGSTFSRFICPVYMDDLLENPAYARCRDKPFPAYDDMEFLTQNTTATGRYAFTSAVELPPIIESSSGSSPGEDDTIAGIGMSACNLSSDPFKAGGSGCARYANFDEANTSRSLSPPVMPTTGASGSGHSSGSKRARSPERSNKQAQTTSTSWGRKKKVDTRTSAYLDIAEQGKEKLGWVRQLCKLELSKSTDMPSQNKCMKRVYGMTGLSDDDILVLCDAFKEEKNRNAFMSLNDKHARKWVEREIAQQNLYYRPSFPGVRQMAYW